MIWGVQWWWKTWVGRWSFLERLDRLSGKPRGWWFHFFHVHTSLDKNEPVLIIEFLGGFQPATIPFLCKICKIRLRSLNFFAIKFVRFFRPNHLSSDQNPAWLFYIRDYTTQLYRDYNKPLNQDPRIPINQPGFNGISFTGFVAVAHFDFPAAFGGVEFEAGRSQFLTQYCTGLSP